MNTKLVSEWKLSKETIEQIGLESELNEKLEKKLNYHIDLFIRSRNDGTEIGYALNNCYASLMPNDTYGSESVRWLCFQDNIYFDKNRKVFWLCKDVECSVEVGNSDSENNLEQELNKKINDTINWWNIPDKSHLQSLLSSTVRPKKLNDFLENVSDFPFRLDKNSMAYRMLSSSSTKPSRSSMLNFYPASLNEKKYKKSLLSLPVDFSRFSDGKSGRKVFIQALLCGFTPNALIDDECYKSLINIYVNKEGDDDLLKIMKKNIIIKKLLNEDKQRADLSPYHQKIIEDTDLGHWSLWQDELDTSDTVTVPLAKKLVARDPKSSINEGVVAIDFGTKSTVVAYQKDNVNIHPMRIGTGDLSKDIAAHHYENPTIMEFVNLNAFFTAYHQKENKPDTRWCDLTISHTAQNSLQGSESSKFNTFLDALKQWAGDKNRNLKVVGQHGKIIDLPPFLSLSDGDFNPIEIYAYYLGLYINNLNNGIFMDYILSFPVTYEVAIRDKIIHSFRNGLKKSLPAELGKETIDKISVVKGASEPAAYALTALQAYHIEPEGDERVFYSVFDFGGGTTDFDFGIYREPTDKKDRRRFDYVIEHFGAGGDKFLGGENLLELLAFEVFKKNKNSLLEQGIQFEKHPERDAFAGSEQLLSRSQEARTNTKQLCIALRPYWEEHDDFSFDASGELQVTVTDVNGVQHSAFGLQIDEQELNAILSSRIERGVENFFDALRLAFSNRQHMLSDISNVKIFLAGNASQSSFVRVLFDKHIALQNQEMGLAEGESRFELFQPLGVDSQDLEKPTGKTGVAFGLIESREGGRIKVIDHNVNDDDIRFKYYLGENRKKKFKPIIERDVSFNEWIDFTFADYQTFEIFYTDQPSTSTGQVVISDTSIKKKVIKLDTTDDDALVFIRVVSPTAIEYVIANEDDIHNDIYLNEINRIEL